jgi:ABC-type transport system substrate-binding protein
MAWPITNDVMIEQVEQDPNLIIAPFVDSYMIYGFNFNVNGTIKSYSGVMSPFNNETFRSAVASLVDKGFIVDVLFHGHADRIDVPLPAAQSEWWNTSVCYPNYPYEFSIQKAGQLLDDAGFDDWDGDGTRNYPLDWEGRKGVSGVRDEPNLDPIIFYVDETDQIRLGMAQSVWNNMETVGIPVDFRPRLSFLMYNDVMVDHNYHIFAGSQLVNSYPIYLCMLGVFTFMFASFGQQWMYANLWKYWSMEWTWPPRPGIGDILQQIGLGQLYWKLSSASSWESAIEYIKRIQGVYTEHCLEVPVCSLKSYFAYRKNIAGIVDEKGYGIDNPYTFLNAYRTDDASKPIRVGLVQRPNMLNVLYSSSLIDNQCLDKVYAGLISYNPYSSTTSQPWIAQDWEVDTWTDPEDNKEKTRVTYWFRKDAYWIKPQTGETDGKFTAKDYEFACYYIYAQYPFIPEARMGCPHFDKFKDIHHIDIIDDFHVQVYMNITSMWAYLLPTYPLLPKHVWLREPLTHNKSGYFEIGYGDLPGEVPLNDMVVSGSEDTKIRARLVNGTEIWLQWGEDFIWKQGTIYVKVDSVDGVRIDKIWVYYWTNGDAIGYTPGSLPWQEILEGCGTHYVINLDEYQYFMCDPNRNFFLETPPLGETDWRWIWETLGGIPGWENPGRDSGHYKIELYDVIKATTSYCHYGIGPYDPKYFPGADIDATDLGHVGINDVIIITGKYGLEWGRPPDP